MTFKDSDEVIRFRSSFNKLKEWTDNEPECLEKLASADESIQDLCWEVQSAAADILSYEKRHREMFSSTVDPKFIADWREYETLYAPHVEAVFLAWLELWLGPEDSTKSPSQTRWDNANEAARKQAGAIEQALEYALEHSELFEDEFPNAFLGQMRAADRSWRMLKSEIGFDLQSVFRRRELVPFINIPTHVGKKYGREEISLFTHLQQAHDAYVMGVPFAALALMRSILETVLLKHYDSTLSDRAPNGNTVPLVILINSAINLPKNVSRTNLHDLRKLANDILHMNIEKAEIPADFEKRVLSFLFDIRNLIEFSPTAGRSKP